jgi:hypothetical protein
MTRIAQFFMKIFFQGLRTPPRTGMELLLTSFTRLVVLGFFISVLVHNLFREKEGLFRLIYTLHLIWMPVVLYLMIEAQFLAIEINSQKDDALANLAAIGGLAILMMLVAGIIFLSFSPLSPLRSPLCIPHPCVN